MVKFYLFLKYEFIYFNWRLITLQYCIGFAIHQHESTTGPCSQSYGFSSSHVWMSELDYKESWAPKNWCFWTVVLEKTLESPLDCKEIQPVHSEGDQPWDFFGRNDAEAETPVLWPPHVKSWLIGKDSDAGRDWGQEVLTTAIILISKITSTKFLRTTTKPVDQLNLIRK